MIRCMRPWVLFRAGSTSNAVCVVPTAAFWHAPEVGLIHLVLRIRMLTSTGIRTRTRIGIGMRLFQFVLWLTMSAIELTLPPRGEWGADRILTGHLQCVPSSKCRRRPIYRHRCGNRRRCCVQSLCVGASHTLQTGHWYWCWDCIVGGTKCGSAIIASDWCICRQASYWHQRCCVCPFHSQMPSYWVVLFGFALLALISDGCY
jgi:hypothetical protein